MKIREYETIAVLDIIESGLNVIGEDPEQPDKEVLEEIKEVSGSDGNPDVVLGRESSKNMLLIGIVIVLLILITGLLVFIKTKRKRKGQQGRLSGMSAGQTKTSPSFEKSRIRVGKVHHMGRRNTQQDSLGVTNTPDGVFAVVADGMGGLADGDKVSQTIVMTMLQDIAGKPEGNTTGRLFEMVSHANEIVNQMLGMQNRYVSGSTVVAVAAGRDSFEWVSVGDSRICLYRGGSLIQLNREHNYESELLWQAVNGEISFAQAWENPERRSLTSFIGMGKLKYIDGSLNPIEAVPGDCLLLMSDGVFNTLSDQEICTILHDYDDPQQAAKALEAMILSDNRPKQDNFTTVILKY